MILRKPYAFLIKHFKFIHIFLAICISFVMIKTWNIHSFLDEYIANDQFLMFTEDISTSYVSLLFLISVGILIIINSVVIYLMKHKKKPVLFYTSNLIIYIVLFILLLFTSGFIYDIQFSTPDLRITKLIKDIYLGAFLIQVPALIISIVRGIGFDIKKFDFRKDIMDFNLSDEDNAEFELQLGIDAEDLRARARKGFRFFKYFYKENKIVFVTIFAVIGMLLTVKVVDVISSIEKIYKENEVFETSTFRIKVLDSYKTYYDFRGNKIDDENFYVIVKLRYYNKSDSIVNITVDNAKLSLDKINTVFPTKAYYDDFFEFGIAYYEQDVLPHQERDFFLVYQVKNEFYNNDLKFKYLYAIDIGLGNQADYKYRTVSLNEKEVNDFSDKSLSTTKLGEELVFKDSFFGNTKIKIKSMSLGNQFRSNEIKCHKGNKCNETTNVFNPYKSTSSHDFTLMRLEYDLEFDEKFGSEYFIDKFIANYGSIRFLVGEKEYTHKVVLEDVISSSSNLSYINRNYTFLNVSDKLYKADEIYLDFTIRDKKYTYIIKEKEVKEEVTDKK